MIQTILQSFIIYYNLFYVSFGMIKKTMIKKVNDMLIKIHNAQQLIECEYQQPVLLSQILKEQQVFIDMPCNGLGICGKCKVIVRGDVSLASPKEQTLLAHETNPDIRLACMTYAQGDCEIILIEQKTQIVTDGYLPPFEYCPTSHQYGFAVDIGTTTVAVYLYSLQDCKLLDKYSFTNPQTVSGADVVSRIQECLNGKSQQLQQMICDKLQQVFLLLCKQNQISATQIEPIVITGNTTMLYLLTHQEVEPLSHAPFEISEYFGKVIPTTQIGLTCLSNATVYLPRTISAFVGSDITCSILSSDLTNFPKPTLMVDIGTNGEMALFHQNQLYCCSTAAGPAFEGADITMGMNAASGAINHVFYQDGTICWNTIQHTKPVGICGSGLIDAIACFIQTGLIDETGLINEEHKQYGHYITEYQEEPAIQIGDSQILITQKDIRAVQLAKAAICAGIYSLIHQAKLEVTAVDSFVLAGGFGSFINCEHAGVIGLIPKELSQKAHSIGNAAGMGAIMILLSQKEQLHSEQIALQAQALNLASSPYFMDKYIECMMF